MSGFPSDVTLAGNPALAIRRLTSILDKSRPDRDKITGRYAAFASEHRRVIQAAQSRAIAEAARASITRQFLSYCVGEAIDDRVVVFNESGVDPQLVPRRLPDTWFEGIAGAAAGAQLAGAGITTLVARPNMLVFNAGRAAGESFDVASPRELAAAIHRALSAARAENVQTTLNVRCESEA